MTYCLALKLREGLVFASDSRTTAGVDYISTYRKMHTFQPRSDRLLVLLTSGNLATTQEVLDNLRRDLTQADVPESFASVSYLFEAARYLGRVLCRVVRQHDAALKASGADARATFILGGQIAGQAPEIYLVYPEGNYVAATEETPFLQLGEFKYGKPILSLASIDMSLDEGARLALISFDAAMKSNLAVGTPLDLATYPANSLNMTHHLSLDADSPLLADLCRRWNAGLRRAFEELPPFEWPEGQAAART